MSVQILPVASDAARSLLDWYDRNARVLPWRTPPGSARRPDPYGVWLSEIMLQQTTVAAVIPYYEKFLARWPTVRHLAAAPLEEVLHAWAGLGYYARARNLHACAQVVVRDHGGRFPESEAALLALPGICAYTAAAIASIAFGQRAVVVDGNVERVVSRLFALEAPLPAARPQVRALADQLTPEARAGDYAQAMMDLGAGVCTPRSPSCGACPLAAGCAARASGTPERWPLKSPKAEKPTRHGLVFWLEAEGQVLLRRRPSRGLLGGLPEIPSSAWSETPVGSGWHLFDQAPVEADWQVLPGGVRHTFTHFHLELRVAQGRLPRRVNPPEGFWHPVAAIEAAGLPTVMLKAARHALTPRLV